MKQNVLAAIALEGLVITKEWILLRGTCAQQNPDESQKLLASRLFIN